METHILIQLPVENWQAPNIRCSASRISEFESYKIQKEQMLTQIWSLVNKQAYLEYA